MSYLDFREVPQPFEERLKIAGKNINLDPNCFGTAFFLAGILPYDMTVSTDKKSGYVERVLSLLKKINSPQDNSFFFMEQAGNDGRIYKHLALIKKAQPLQAYQRTGRYGSLETITSLNKVYSYFRLLSRSYNLDLRVETEQYYALPKSRRKNKRLESWAREVVASYNPQARW